MKSGDLENMTSYGTVGQQFGLGSAGHGSAVGLQFCSPGSAGFWLGNMAPGLHVSRHPAGRPQLVHTQKREASKSSKRASSRAGALFRPFVFTNVSMAQARPTRHADSRAGLHLRRGEVGPRNARAHIQVRQGISGHCDHLPHTSNGWHLRILYLSARTHLGMVPNTMGYF